MGKAGIIDKAGEADNHCIMGKAGKRVKLVLRV